MSADEMRQAAATLRERVEGATEGASWTGGHYWIEDYDPRDPSGMTSMQREIGGMESAGDANYFATMHPGVGLALADLLDTLAYDREVNYEIDGRTWDHDIVPLARLINGGAA